MYLWVTSRKASSQIQTYIHWLLCYIFFHNCLSNLYIIFIFDFSNGPFFLSAFSLSSAPYATIAPKTTVMYRHTLKRPILMQYFPISVYNSHMEKGSTASLNNFYGFSYHLFLSYSNLDIQVHANVIYEWYRTYEFNYMHFRGQDFLLLVLHPPPPFPYQSSGKIYFRFWTLINTF